MIFKTLSASGTLVATLGALGSNAGWQMDFYVNFARRQIRDAAGSLRFKRAATDPRPTELM